METQKSLSTEPVIPELKGIGETVEFMAEPNLEKLGEINLGKHDRRDHEFLKRLILSSVFDPELLSRIINIRTKLANSIKITNLEAEEIINRLQAKSFIGDLDISEYKFHTLDMASARITGDFNSSFVTVYRDNNQNMTEIGGNNNQEEMVVGRDNWQQGMKVEKNSNQKEMTVGRSSYQGGVEIKGRSDQEGMAVEGIWFKNQ